MTLEGVNALLCWVGAVIMGWHEFQFVFVFIHNNGRGVVIESAIYVCEGRHVGVQA